MDMRRHSDRGEGSGSKKEITYKRCRNFTDSTDDDPTKPKEGVASGNWGAEGVTKEYLGAHGVMDAYAQSINANLEKAKEIISAVKNKSSGTQIFDVIKNAGSKSHENSFEGVKKQIGSFIETAQNFLQRMDTPHISYQVKDNLLRATHILSEKLPVFSKQFVDSYGDRSKKGSEKCINAEESINDCNKKIQNVKQDLDTWHPIDHCKRSFEQVLPSIPEKYQSLLQDSVNGHSKMAQQAYEQIIEEEYQQGNEQPDDRERFHRASQWFKKLKQDLDTWSSIHQSLTSIEQTPVPKNLLSRLQNLATGAGQAYEQVIKGHGDGSEQPEARKHLDNASRWSKEVKEDLDTWEHIIKGQTEIKKMLRDTPEESQPLLQNLKDRKLAEARQAHAEILEGYEQGSERSEARKRFDNASHWFEETPNKLKNVAKARASLTQRLEQVKFPSEQVENLLQDWTEQIKSYEYTEACLGEIDARANKNFGQDVKSYSKYCKDTHAKIKTLYESKDFEAAKTSVEQWQEVQKGFEKFLAGQGY